ncbi:MFS transporter [Streptomyces albidoflavus]
MDAGEGADRGGRGGHRPDRARGRGVHPRAPARAARRDPRRKGHRPPHGPLQGPPPAPPAVLSGLWFVACYVNHGIGTWLPSLCTDTFGVDRTAALTFSLISNATGLLGTFLMALFIDRIGRRTSLLVALTGAAPALAVLAAGGSLRLVFARLAVVAAVGALIAFFAVETTGRPLEEHNS